LFGVAPAEAMSMIIVAEDRFFLEDQRGPQIHVGYMDRTFARMEKRKVKRLKHEEHLRNKEEYRQRENDELLLKKKLPI